MVLRCVVCLLYYISITTMVRFNGDVTVCSVIVMVVLQSVA